MKLLIPFSNLYHARVHHLDSEVASLERDMSIYPVDMSYRA